jgi:hypothetical protein
MSTNEEDKRTSHIPETSTTKPMDSKRDVEESNDEKIGWDFPGYPHYPAKEDIMDQRTGSHHVDAGVENTGTGPNASGVSQRFMDGQDNKHAEGTVTPGTGAANSDDLKALNSTDSEIGTPQNVSNEDLNTDTDIPGSELEADSEKRGV